MGLRDRFKVALSRKLGFAPSGTAEALLFTGVQTAGQILNSLLLGSGAGLTASDISIGDALESYEDLSLEKQTYAEACSLIAESADGYMFNSRKGILTFRTNTPIFGTATAVVMTLGEDNFAKNIFWEQALRNRLSRVDMEFASGTDVSLAIVSPNQTAQSLTISNDNIENTSDAISIGSRTLDRFSAQVTTLEIPGIWLPSLDIGDKIGINSDNVFLTGARFDICAIREQPTRGTMRIDVIRERDDVGKFGFFSDVSAAVCGNAHGRSSMF